MEVSTAMVTNPFENHLIIDKILQYVQFDVLKALRHVNSFWNQFATPVLQQKAWVHLGESNIEKFMEFQRECEQSEDGSNVTKLQFQNYLVKSVELNLGAGDSQFASFMAKYGQGVEEIVLDKCTFAFQSDAVKLLSDCLPNCTAVSICCPNVEPGGLGPGQLDSKPNWSVKYLEIIPDAKNMKILWWEQLFHLLPGLTSLNVQCRNLSDQTLLLDALLNSNPQLTRLSEFSSFLSELNDHHLRQLIHLNVKFTALDLNLCAQSATHPVLHDLLAHSAKTLKSLKLFHGTLPSGFNQFPIVFLCGFPYGVRAPLETLQNLELIGDMIPSFAFLQQVPNLSRLNILQACNEDESSTLESLHIENTKNTNVVRHDQLRHLSMEYSLRPECIRKLATAITPNLSSISMYLSDDSIRAVFRYCSGLEELSVLGTEVTDEGITGIGLEVLLSMDANDVQLQGLNKRRKFPYIGDCALLRKFSLYAQPQENISDYSVYLGFMKMRSLTALDLPLTAITDKGIETLQTKRNLIHLASKFCVEDGAAYKRPPHLQEWHCSKSNNGETSQ